MNERRATVVEVIARISEAGGKCTFEHVQAALHLLQAHYELPLGYRFILSEYRPYSEALDEELATLRRTGWIQATAERNGHRAPTTVLAAIQRQTLQQGWSEAVEEVSAGVASLSALEALVLSTAKFVQGLKPRVGHDELVDLVYRVTAGIDRETILNVLDRLANAGLKFAEDP